MKKIFIALLLLSTNLFAAPVQVFGNVGWFGSFNPDYDTWYFPPGSCPSNTVAVKGQIYVANANPINRAKVTFKIYNSNGASSPLINDTVGATSNTTRGSWSIFTEVPFNQYTSGYFIVNKPWPTASQMGHLDEFGNPDYDGYLSWSVNFGCKLSNGGTVPPSSYWQTYNGNGF